MKTKVTLLAAALLSVVTSATAAPFDEYKAGQFQVEAIAFSDTTDLKEFDSGGGVGVTYWHWKNAGLGFEGKTFETQHALFDTLGLNLAARFPIEKLKFAAITRLGFDWQAEQVNPRRKDDFDVYASVGVEKRIKAYSIGAELRGVRAATLEPAESLQFLIRAGRTF